MSKCLRFGFFYPMVDEHAISRLSNKHRAYVYERLSRFRRVSEGANEKCVDDPCGSVGKYFHA